MKKVLIITKSCKGYYVNDLEIPDNVNPISYAEAVIDNYNLNRRGPLNGLQREYKKEFICLISNTQYAKVKRGDITIEEMVKLLTAGKETLTNIVKPNTNKVNVKLNIKLK